MKEIQLKRAKLWLALMASILLGAGMIAFGDDGAAKDETDWIFDQSFVHDINITINPDTWELMREQALTPWQRATFIFDGEVLLEEVGVEIGATRRVQPERYYDHPNLHVNFAKYRSNQSLYGLKQLAIRGFCCDDDSIMANWLGVQLYAAFGLPVGRLAFARVTVNDEYIGPFWIMEREVEVVPRFFRNGGNLYKLQNTANRRSRNRDAFWRDPMNPTAPRSYVPIPFKPFAPRSPAPDGRDIVDLVWAANQATPAAVRLALDPLLDLDNLINYLAVDMALADADGLVSYSNEVPRQYYQDDVFLYRDPTSRKFFLIPHEFEGAFTAFDPTYSVNRGLTDGWDTLLITKWLLRDPELMAQYYDAVQAFLDYVYIPDQVVQQIDAMAALIRPAVRDDLTRSSMPRPVTMAQWEASVAALRAYIPNRVANVRRQLARP